MKVFFEEYGKLIVAIICVTFSLGLITAVYTGQFTPFLKNAYSAQERISNKTAVGRDGSKVSSNKELSDTQKGKTAKITFNNALYDENSEDGNADVNGLNLMIREKEYELPLNSGGTYKFTGSEWFAFNNTFQQYGIDSTSDTRKWYILSLNPEASGLADSTSSERTTQVDSNITFNDITTVAFDFESQSSTDKDYILLTFEKNSDGTIKTDGSNQPILKSYKEVSTLKYTKDDGKTLKSLDEDFDIIVFKKTGIHRIKYFLTDKAGYSTFEYGRVSIENVYGAMEGTIYETLWND